jgi:hypothetical protein
MARTTISKYERGSSSFQASTTRYEILGRLLVLNGSARSEPAGAFRYFKTFRKRQRIRYCLGQRKMLRHRIALRPSDCCIATQLGICLLLNWRTALIGPSPAHSFYFSRVSGPPSSDAVIGEQSPLSHVRFNPFKLLGFAFWIEERMLGYGLLRPMPGQPHWPRRTITLTSTTTPGKASSTQMILLK